MKLIYSVILTHLLLASSTQAVETQKASTPTPTIQLKNDSTVGTKQAPETPPSVPPASGTQLSEKYVNTEKGYSIQFPSDWKKSDVPRLDLVLFIPPKGSELDTYASMNIVSEKVGPEITLNEFYTESTNNLSKALKDVKVDKSGQTPINGVQAKWIVYTHEMRSISFRVVQYFVVANETVYLLTFSSSESSFDLYKYDFENVANTFRLVSKENTKPNT